MYDLIDTQALIWFCEDNPCLPASVKQYMERSNGLVVSMASFWEITIKTSLGNLTTIGNIAEIMDKAVFKGFKLLTVEREHLIVLSTLDLMYQSGGKSLAFRRRL